MSHFSRIATKLSETDKLKEALERLGHEVEMGPTHVRGYQGQQEPVDLAIRRPEGYDIGFRKRLDGGDVEDAGVEVHEMGDVEMVVDKWGLKIDEKEFLQAVTQQYAYCVIREQATLDGFVLIEEETQEDGTVRLIFEEADATS